MLRMRESAAQDLSRPPANPVTARPPCPNCGRPMHLALVSPDADGSSKQRTYCCGECGLSHTEAAGESPAMAA